MDLFACRDGAQTGFFRVLSTGGGAITLVGRPDAALPEVYAETSYAESQPCAKATMPDCPIMWSVTKENIFGMIYIACGKP